MICLSTQQILFRVGIRHNNGKNTNQIAREETICRQMGYSFRLASREFLYAPSHRQDNTKPQPLLHQLCSTGWNKK